MSNAEKKSKYKRLREEKKELYGELNESEIKELIWFVVNHGPFRKYLKRLRLYTSDTCRLCGHCLETPEHLVKESDETREIVRIEDENDLLCLNCLLVLNLNRLIIGIALAKCTNELCKYTIGIKHYLLLHTIAITRYCYYKG